MDNLFGFLGFVFIAAILVSPFLAIAYLRRRDTTRVAAAPETSAAPEQSDRAKKTSNGISPVFLVLLTIGGVWWWWSSQPSFSDSEVASIKGQIKEQYQKKAGVSVQDVVMVRESAAKLTGYVKLHVAGVADEIMKECTATTDAKSSFWSCK